MADTAHGLLQAPPVTPSPLLQGVQAAQLLGIAPGFLPPRLGLRATAGAEANELIAADIARRLAEAVQARGRAVLAVSGGRSPLPLFAALAARELPWGFVDITLVDERAVPQGHAAGNATLVREALLQGPAGAARFHPWPAATLDVQAVEQMLAALGPADVTVLGLGTDGHTASLFPGAAGVEEMLRVVDPGAEPPAADGNADRTGIAARSAGTPGASATHADPDGNERLRAMRCAVVIPDPLPPEAPYARLTQTPMQLVRSRHLLLPLSGEAKRATLVRALQAPAWERRQHYPIGSLLHQTLAPVEVWLIGASVDAPTGLRAASCS